MSKYQHDLRNWWCVKCRAWLASCDIDAAQRHRECGTRCEWREYRIEWAEEKRDAKASKA